MALKEGHHWLVQDVLASASGYRTMIAWEQFDRIYLINLAYRPDRRRHALKEIKQVIGIDLPQLQIFDAIRPGEEAGFPSIGARGCFLSHLSVLRQSLAAGHERILVLEDDIHFEPSIRDVSLPPHWDLLYLGHQIMGPPPTRVAEPSEHVLYTHSYAISRPAMKLLVEFLEGLLTRQPGDPAGGPQPLDWAFNWFRKTAPQLSTWIMLPPVCRQAHFLSDITHRRWHDRVPWIRPFAISARALLRAVSSKPAR